MSKLKLFILIQLSEMQGVGRDKILHLRQQRLRQCLKIISEIFSCYFKNKHVLEQWYIHATFHCLQGVES